MQRSVYEGWIDSLTEREFDQPFLALLRAHGFFDIHFTHGAYEYGKDFIAKRVEAGVVAQYGFQSKAGNIGGGEWNTLLGQTIELTEAWLTHPNYDAGAPREHRLVTTGRLVGKAILGAKQFRESLVARSGGNFLVWDREYLLDLLRGNAPDFPANEPHPAVEWAVAEVRLGRCGLRSLAQFLELAAPREVSGVEQIRAPIFDATLLLSELERAKLPFHSLLVAAHLARLSLCLAYAEGCEGQAKSAFREAMDTYVDTGERMLAGAISAIDDADALFDWVGGTIEAWIAYPATCTLLAEYLGVSGLWHYYQGRRDLADRARDRLVRLIERQPGLGHIPSDRYAVSLVPATLLLWTGGARASIKGLLHKTTVWLCDRIEADMGLAGPYADPAEEVNRLLGASFDFIAQEPRRNSLLAVVLADCANYFCPEVYSDVVNDLLAVKAVPSMVHPKDQADSMFLNRRGTLGMINLRYPDEPQPCLEHHSLQPDARAIERIGGFLAPLVVASLCRDRALSDVFPRFMRAT